MSEGPQVLPLALSALLWGVKAVRAADALTSVSLVLQSFSPSPKLTGMGSVILKRICFTWPRAVQVHTE